MKRSKTNSGLLNFLEKIVRSHPLTYYIIRQFIRYTNILYKDYLKNKYSIIEIHNRPESLLYLLSKKVTSKLIFTFHNNPKDMRGSTSVNERSITTTILS